MSTNGYIHKSFTNLLTADDGVGIESVGGTVGSKRSFTVETFSAGRGDVQVTVTNPLGTVEPVCVPVYLSVSLALSLSVCLSVCLSL